jgi:hypothetical protein
MEKKYLLKIFQELGEKGINKSGEGGEFTYDIFGTM